MEMAVCCFCKMLVDNCLFNNLNTGTMKKNAQMKTYEAPVLRIVEAAVENGYALSPFSGGNQDNSNIENVGNSGNNYDGSIF